MAPGKKHKLSFKPGTTYVHPSLRGGAPQPAPSVPTKNNSASVSDRIQYLRRVQTPTPASVAEVERDMSTLHISSTPRTRIAGPPPPKSWLAGDTSATSSIRSSTKQQIRRPRRPNYFPGSEMPKPSSLRDLAMKAMASEVHWHLVYDHDYLSALPVELKGMFLSYIACYSPPDGVTSRDIKTIFTTPENSGLLEATGADGLDRLDLACSIGRSISFEDLTRLWLIRSSSKQKATASQSDGLDVEPDTPESWEDSWDMWRTRAAPQPLLDSNLRFPSVRKLSLAYPGPQTSWSSLISFSKHLSHLTHLSLAGWPTATIAFDEAIISTSADLKRVIAREHRSIACDVLRVVARNTPNLTYFSLADCHVWFADISRGANTSATGRSRASRLPRIDVSKAFEDRAGTSAPTARTAVNASLWNYVWRNLKQLDLSQSMPVPNRIAPSALRRLYEARRWRLGTDAAQPLFAGLGSIRAREPELYTVISSSSATLSAVEERALRRQWVGNEDAALELTAHINKERHEGGLPILDVRYGWDAEDLLEAGYGREDVWLITGLDLP